MADPNMSAYQTMATYLNSLGLGQLAGVGADGAPTGWLWQQMVAGVDTPDALTQAIEQTDVWRNRFGAIVQQRADAAAGKPVQVMSVDQLVQYEDSVSKLMRDAALPSTFATRDYIDKLAVQGFSVSEVADHLGTSFDRVRNIDPHVRQAFEDFYGVGQGDGALAAYFLDPEHTMAQLDKQSRVAYTAGLGAKYGIGISQSQANDITTFAPTDAAVNQGLGQVASLADVTRNSLFEGTQLSTDTAVKSVFEQNAAATADINKRIAERRAVNTTAIGGAALTQQGLTGVGSA